MEWILNELSLERRFNSVDDFVCYLVELFKVKNSHPNLIDRFLCPRNIGNIQVVADKTFAQLVMQDVPKDLKTGILSWINKTGPFWCDDRAENQDDYFEHNDVDVTDRGLGECARRVIVGSSISAFSVNGQSFDYSPITINHGLPDERLGQYSIENIFEYRLLTESAQAAMPLPVNWQQALEQFVQKYQGYLVFSNDVYEHIRPTPFSIADFRSLDQRFGVLKRYLESRTAGMHTANSNEILREFFQGTIDWFSQESETNKKEFSEQLQFISPVSGEKVDFSWHGKVKSQANLRFYFAWPIPAEQNIIHIVYLGQKITKQ